MARNTTTPAQAQTPAAPSTDKAAANATRKIIASALGLLVQAAQARKTNKTAEAAMAQFVYEPYTSGNCLYFTDATGQRYRVVVKAVKAGEAEEQGEEQAAA